MDSLNGRLRTGEYELVSSRAASEHNAEAPSAQTDEDELLAPEEASRARAQFQRPLPWDHGLGRLVLAQALILPTLVGGLLLALVCFSFTYWLSRQIYNCPSWAIGCRELSSAHWFYVHLNQVQGVVSAIFSVAVDMMAYATYQIAAMTLWPALARRSFSLRDIDNHLNATRGSFQAVPAAVWTARGLQQSLVMVILATLAVLLVVESVIVGHAFSLVEVPTPLYSNVTSGGGIGFGFSQTNPPGALPGAVGDAVAIYTAWANELNVEPMPRQRNFIMDRANLSVVGNFSAFAVEILMDIDCSPKPINITADVNVTAPAESFEVGVNLSSSSFVYVQPQPMLMVWVDSIWSVNETAALTRLMFAAMGGGIEGGYWNSPTLGLEYDFNFTGISTLSCDVTVNLEDGEFCTAEPPATCAPPNTTLSSVETIGVPYDEETWGISMWLGAATDFFGISVSGTQLMFSPGPILTNSTYALPIAFTSTAAASDYSFNWTQANLTHFIEVSAGAIGITIMRHFPDGSSILPSVLPMRRMSSPRAFVLLVPVGVELVCLLCVAAVCVWAHRVADVPEMRTGTTSEVLVSSQTDDMREAIRQASRSTQGTNTLARLRFKYGVVQEGHDGLATEGNLTPFTAARTIAGGDSAI